MTGESTVGNPHDVKIGQVWRDNDKRMDRRFLTVTDVGETHATVYDGVKVTKIRLDRFKPTSTGYVLETDVA